ncbi:MAG: GNAT family N-acetyltransferase [Dehalococcoidia bacterium]
MKISVGPFERSRHLDDAAWLLSERQRRDRQHDDRLPVIFEAPDPCRPLIEQALSAPGAYGVFATADGKPAGFGIMSVQLFAPTHFLSGFFPPRGASFSHSAHAAAEGIEYDVYREMYAALGEHYVAQGYFDHTVNLSASDRAAQDAFTSLGFGRTMACAIRGVDPVERAAANVELHQASAEDEAVIFDLNTELMLHHARSPIFQPMVRETDESSHEMQRGLLADPDANAHWVAYEDGRPVGMNTFMAPTFLSPMTLPDKTIYLFQGIVAPDARAGGVGSAILSKGVEWARGKGYEHVALHFAAPNVPGAKFWQSSRFVPVEYGMRRHIDERIAWANR